MEIYSGQARLPPGHGAIDPSAFVQEMRRELWTMLCTGPDLDKPRSLITALFC